MNITMLSNFGSPTRGVSPYSDMLSDEITKQGVTVSKQDYSSAYPLALKKIKKEKLSIHYLNPLSWVNMVKTSSEIIHIQYWTQVSAYYLYIISKLAKNKKIIVTVHNPSPHEKIPAFSIFEKYFLREASHIIVHTNEGAQLLESTLSISSAKISVIAHGILSTESVFIPKKEQTPYILAAGNIRPYKGVSLLIDAWKDIYALYPDHRLIIAGKLWGRPKGAMEKIIHFFLKTEHYSKKIEKKLEHHNSYNIQAKLDFLDDSELIHLIKNAKILALPYKNFSGQSGIAACAASFGTPIMCSNIPGLKQLAISNEYLFDAPTKDAISEKLKNQLNKISDSDRVKQWELAQKYSWESSAKQHIKLYSLLNNSDGR